MDIRNLRFIDTNSQQQLSYDDMRRMYPGMQVRLVNNINMESTVEQMRPAQMAYNLGMMMNTPEGSTSDGTHPAMEINVGPENLEAMNNALRDYGSTMGLDTTMSESISHSGTRRYSGLGGLTPLGEEGNYNPYVVTSLPPTGNGMTYRTGSENTYRSLVTEHGTSGGPDTFNAKICKTSKSRYKVITTIGSGLPRTLEFNNHNCTFGHNLVSFTELDENGFAKSTGKTIHLTYNFISQIEQDYE